MRRIALIVLLVGPAVPGLALGAEFDDYPQFRYTAGLPGDGFGVDPAGHVGFEGALHACIPVGYTPGLGNFALVAESGAINGGFPDDIYGPDVNGNLSAGLGLLRNPAVWFTYMAVDADDPVTDAAFNLQVQLLRPSPQRPGVAVGVLDLRNARRVKLSDPLAHKPRSFFLVATHEVGSPKNPVYCTAGVGLGRFEGVFGGVSFHPVERVCVFAEYDALSPNVGIACDVLPRRSEWHGVLSLVLIDLDRISLSVALTKTDF